MAVDSEDLVFHRHMSTINSREANVPLFIQICIQLQFAWRPAIRKSTLAENEDVRTSWM